MDRKMHNRLAHRIRQIIASRAGLPESLASPASTEGGAWMGAGVRGRGVSGISGAGKHKADAKTRKPNKHALKVKAIMAANPGMKLAEASRLAAQQ